ncbi:MAG: M15 family metallopeptidase [Candidatus Saccharimonadales bacterium]
MRHTLPTPRRSTSWFGVVLLVVIAGIIGWYIFMMHRSIVLAYDSSDVMAEHAATSSLLKLTLPGSDTPLYVPSRDIFASNGAWVYATKNYKLPASYVSTDLQPLTLPFSSSDSEAKISTRIAQPLTQLFAAAKADGHDLIVSSAYRSLAAQHAMYDDFVAKKGKTLADQYVSPPGSSEHHTGLAVDINDNTATCRANPEKCSIGTDSAAWLARHAPDYGFIIRYPAGAQPITGIAYEPWHLRYVGVVLARHLTAAELTFDEFRAQATPGIIKSPN